MTQRVLILGARAPTALDHARRFHRHGWQVHVADSIPYRLSGWSRSITRTHSLRSPRYDTGGFIADLNRIVTAHRIDLLLPTCEEAFYVSRYRAWLPKQLHVAIDDFEKLSLLHSKWAFLGMAHTHGMPVPDSHCVRTLAQARAWATGRAVVLKPEFSRFGVHVRMYPRGIPGDAPELPSLGRWVVQALIPGDEVCSYAIAHRGRLLAHAVYRPAYRLRRSSSYYFDPIQQPAIRDTIASFIHGTDYSGQISFDWIQTSDGQALALECNPRSISGLHLFPLDTDLPSALLGEGGLHEPTGTRAKMIAPLMFTAGLRSTMKTQQFAQWWHDYRRADDVISLSDDHLPLAGGMSDLGAYAWLALRQRCHLREAATRDIEWDGEPLETLKT